MNKLTSTRTTTLNQQIKAVLTRMKNMVDSGLVGAELVKQFLPIVLELNELRDRQFSLFNELLRTSEVELNGSNQKLFEMEAQIMALKVAPILNDIALQFIREKGLREQFFVFTKKLEDEASLVNNTTKLH